MATLKEALAIVPTTTCNFQKWFDGLDAEDKTSVIEALQNDAWSVTALLNILRQHGLKVSRDTLTRHRKGNCDVCKSLGFA